MKRKMINVLILLLVLAGAVILVYPYANFWLSGSNQSNMIQRYDDSLGKLTQEQLKVEWERAKAYNDALSPNAIYDPFTIGQSEMNDEYLSLLNLDGNGVMGSIKIPRINVELPIFHGATSETMKKGVGHLMGTALPVGGDGIHTVLTGHTGLNTAKLFTDLTELTVGDEFYIYTLDQILAYRVDQIIVVEPTDVEALLPVPGKDYVTLVTCTPYGSNSHRLLVRGERIAYTPEEINQRIADIEAVTSKETWMLYVGISLIILLVLVVLANKCWKRKPNR